MKQKNFDVDETIKLDNNILRIKKFINNVFIKTSPFMDATTPLRIGVEPTYDEIRFK